MHDTTATHHRSHAAARRGSALLLAMAMVVTLAAMAVTLTTITINRTQEQTRRQNEVRLLVATESGAHETMDWMQSNPNSIKVLPAHPEVILGVGLTKIVDGNVITLTPEEKLERQYELVKALPASRKIVSTTQPTSNRIFNALTMSNGATAPGQLANMRNGCTVEAIIVCLKQTEPANSWPDGFEKFLVFVTATQGSIATDATSYRRRRVATVVSTSTMKVFKQTMYAFDGYQFMGSASTDSWPGPPALPTPANNTRNGDIVSGNVVTRRGGATVSGDIISNKSIELPTLTYDPPAGAINLGSISAPRVLNGPTVVRATQMTTAGELTITGSGDVELYVDGPINTKKIIMAAGSTARLIIRQSDYNIGLGDSQFDLNGGAIIGDIGGGGVSPDPSRVMLLSNYSGNMRWNGNGQMSAVVFAPYANMSINGTFNMWGSVVSRAFDGRVNGNFKFHYDDSLANLSLPLAPQLTAAGWHSVNLGIHQD